MGKSHGVKCLSSGLRFTTIEVLFRPRIICFDKLLVVCNTINAWLLLVGWGLPHRDVDNRRVTEYYGLLLL